VRAETERTLDAFQGHPGYIFNLGSGILPKTPVESVAAAFETLSSRQRV
jgi:uroporphyrinogen decarboxylase